jgi:hypothetical protein
VGLGINAEAELRPRDLGKKTRLLSRGRALRPQPRPQISMLGMLHLGAKIHVRIKRQFREDVYQNGHNIEIGGRGDRLTE